MKFLAPNYSCLQNPWLGVTTPKIPILSVLNWICWTPPEKNSWVRHCTKLHLASCCRRSWLTRLWEYMRRMTDRFSCVFQQGLSRYHCRQQLHQLLLWFRHLHVPGLHVTQARHPYQQRGHGRYVTGNAPSLCGCRNSPWRTTLTNLCQLYPLFTDLYWGWVYSFWTVRVT